MRLRTHVIVVLIVAALLLTAIWRLAPPPADWAWGTIATMTALALTAELINFLLPRSASSSIAFVPAMTTLLLVPNFAALVAIGGTMCIGTTLRRAGLLKITFNTAQVVLSYGVGVLVYRSLGGTSLFDLRGIPATDVTVRIGIPMTAAYIAQFALNSLAVSQVVAISTGGKTLQVWRENNAPTVALDILALPVVFAFAWVYANYGPMFASLIWLPVLGLRQMNTVNIELAQTNRELLELMIKSIEARDPYTSGHSRRVSDYATRIARLVGVNRPEVEKIATAALLHDVGKIYDKYAPILAKDERLSAEEWAIIKEHPLDGANLIATMTRLRELVPSVMHHHENWDGTGYPAGLRGEEIPLASRIIMFADTIDAMTTTRPYRGPLGEEEVRAELIRCRGRQFDPLIADRLLAGDFWASLFPPQARTTERGILQLVAGGIKN